LVEGCPIVGPRTPAIRRHTLLACEPFSQRLGASAVATAIASGLREGGAPAPDIVELGAGEDDLETAALLSREDFHARMLAARAVVIAVRALAEQTLAGSAAFEAATLARQSGVPCYAVAASVELNEFDLRILDLQVALRARGAAELRAAGRRLAGIV
jgi:hypothetical protein